MEEVVQPWVGPSHTWTGKRGLGALLFETVSPVQIFLGSLTSLRSSNDRRRTEKSKITQTERKKERKEDPQAVMREVERKEVRPKAVITASLRETLSRAGKQREKK